MNLEASAQSQQRERNGRQILSTTEVDLAERARPDAELARENREKNLGSHGDAAGAGKVSSSS
jgi:hypothetical protein